jgi:hypothetical protein
MKLPGRIAYDISRRAVAIAYDNAPKETGSGASKLQPVFGEGIVGINAPDYMIVQNFGAKPRIMWELSGKVIPIRLPSGQIIFRTASPSNIGKMKITSRDEKGKIITSKMSWKYPGLKGSHFIDNALKQAFNEWARSLTGSETISLLEETEVKFLIDSIKDLR